MKLDIDVDQLMTDTWLIVTLLKQGAMTLDGSALYDKCCQQVINVREALERAGYDEVSIEHISYAQCALLDEAVMSRKPNGPERGEEAQVDAGQVAWRKAPLQARFFGSLHAGEALWDRLAEVLQQPSPVNAVLICYHRVISLGFQGLYSVQAVNQSQREALISALSNRVAPPDTGLSLVIHRTKKHRYSLAHSAWFWIVIAVVLTGTVWWGGHLWLQELLSAQIPELPR